MVAAHTIIVHTSGTDAATLILASLGVVLALASLAWQARTFIVTGSRITVEVRPGLMGIGSVVTMPPEGTADQLAYMRSQGYTDPVFAVRVNNTGRGSTSVVSVELAFDGGGSVGNTVYDPPLPFRLDGESEQTWYIESQTAIAFAKTAAQMKPTGKPGIVRGRVKLGNTKVVTSKTYVPIPTT